MGDFVKAVREISTALNIIFDKNYQKN